jgi:hypothetical protein
MKLYINGRQSRISVKADSKNMKGIPSSLTEVWHSAIVEENNKKNIKKLERGGGRTDELWA